MHVGGLLCVGGGIGVDGAAAGYQVRSVGILTH